MGRNYEEALAKAKEKYPDVAVEKIKLEQIETSLTHGSPLVSFRFPSSDGPRRLRT